MKRAHIFIVAVLAVAVQCSNALKTLNTQDFEHTTQAATGQTTGVWLVRFCWNEIPSCENMNLEWEALADEMLEQQIFLADVNVAEDPELASRFQLISFPAYILFRGRRMYKKGPTATIEELRDWSKDGYRRDLDMEVPPPSQNVVVAAITATLQIAKTKALELKMKFDQTLKTATTGAPDERLQAKAQLALPVLLTCLFALIVMWVKVKPSAAAPQKQKKERRQRVKRD